MNIKFDEKEHISMMFHINTKKINYWSVNIIDDDTLVDQCLYGKYASFKSTDLIRQD